MNLIKNTNKNFPFKRNFYYTVENAINSSNVVFLLGSRKCGKTIALLQLEGSKGNSCYYDFKKVADDESMNIFFRN